MEKVSFLGLRARTGRKCCFIDVPGTVEDHNGNPVETVVRIWIAPLNQLDFGHAQDIAGSLVNDWIGGIVSKKPRFPLECFGDEPPPHSLTSDVALLVRAQAVAEQLHKGGMVDESCKGEDGTIPPFISYNEIELAAMFAAGHPAFSTAVINVQTISNGWEGEKSQNPTPGSGDSLQLQGSTSLTQE